MTSNLNTCNVRWVPTARLREPELEIEFKRDGKVVEVRAYYQYQHELFGRRITEWIRDGVLGKTEL